MSIVIVDGGDHGWNWSLDGTYVSQRKAAATAAIYGRAQQGTGPTYLPALPVVSLKPGIILETLTAVDTVSSQVGSWLSHTP